MLEQHLAVLWDPSENATSKKPYQNGTSAPFEFLHMKLWEASPRTQKAARSKEKTLEK